MLLASLWNFQDALDATLWTLSCSRRSGRKSTHCLWQYVKQWQWRQVMSHRDLPNRSGQECTKAQSDDWIRQNAAFSTLANTIHQSSRLGPLCDNLFDFHRSSKMDFYFHQNHVRLWPGTDISRFLQATLGDCNQRCSLWSMGRGEWCDSKAWGLALATWDAWQRAMI